MKRVQFFLPDDVFVLLQTQSAAKCKTGGEYARDATVAYITNHPAKGVVAQLVALRGSNPVGTTTEANSPALPDKEEQ